MSVRDSKKIVATGMRLHCDQEMDVVVPIWETSQRMIQISSQYIYKTAQF